MATYFSNAWACNVTTDALFRQNVATFKAAMDAIGIVRVPLASNIDETTVTNATAANQIKGGELYRFNDALQATAPVYIRVDYGGGDAAAQACLWVTVGTAYDAVSGEITGFYRSAKWRITGDNNSPPALPDCRFSGGPNRLTFSLVGNHTGSQGYYGHQWLTVERLKDATGADTANGIVWLGGRGYTGDQRIFWLPFSGDVLPNACENNIPGVISTNGTQTFGGNTGVFPIYPMAGVALNPPIGYLACQRTDFARGDQTPVTIYGVSRNYICACNNGTSYSMHGANGPVGSRPMMLWE